MQHDHGGYRRTNLTFRGIEKRFQELDAVQQRLTEMRERREMKSRRGGGSSAGKVGAAASGEGQSDGASAATFLTSSAADYSVNPAAGGTTSRVGVAVLAAAAASRARLSERVQSDVGGLRARATRLLAEHRVLAQQSTLNSVLGGHVELGRPLPDENADVVVNRGGQERFDALFSDDSPHDRMQQAKTIARLISGAAAADVADTEDDEVRRAASQRQNLFGSAGAASRSPPRQTSPPRSDSATRPAAAPQYHHHHRGGAGGGTAGATPGHPSSPYVNPRPPQVRRAFDRLLSASAAAAGAGDASVKRPQSAQVAASLQSSTSPLAVVRPQTAQCARPAANASSSATMNLAAHFFKQLPPVIAPKPGVKQLARRYAARPGSAPGAEAAAAVPQYASSRPTTPSALPMANLTPAAATALRHYNADDAIFTKEFYFLHVKVIHTHARLADWEFSVTVTDITDPHRLLRHTFKHLKVNANMHIVFKPPHQVYLSPADDIPWVAAPEALFMHTLRIEVYATYPNTTKVVDTMVFFGDVVPSDAVATRAASLPPRPVSAAVPATPKQV